MQKISFDASTGIVTFIDTPRKTSVFVHRNFISGFDVHDNTVTVTADNHVAFFYCGPRAADLADFLLKVISDSCYSSNFTEGSYAALVLA